MKDYKVIAGIDLSFIMYPQVVQQIFNAVLIPGKGPSF